MSSFFSGFCAAGPGMLKTPRELHNESAHSVCTLSKKVKSWWLTPWGLTFFQHMPQLFFMRIAISAAPGPIMLDFWGIGSYIISS